MKNKRLYGDMPSEETLSKRFVVLTSLMLITYLVAIVLGHIFISYETQEGFLSTWVTVFSASSATAFIFAVYMAVKYIYYLRGYDVPHEADYERADLNTSNMYISATILYGHRLVGWGSFIFWVIGTILFLIQWGMVSLWVNVGPWTIMTPVGIVTPFIVTSYVRRFNRKRKLGQKEVYERLNGDI